jgi:hypothetical protein
MEPINYKTRKLCYEIPWTCDEHYNKRYAPVYNLTKLKSERLSENITHGIWIALINMDWKPYEN